MKIKDLILGVCRVEITAATPAVVLDLLMSARIVYRDLEAEAAENEHERGSPAAASLVRLFCSLPAARRLARVSADAGIPCRYIVEGGFPAAAAAAKGRPAMMLGALMAILLLWLGESVIWGVRVVGADDVISATEVRELFAKAGVYPGAAIAGIRGDHAAAHVVAGSDRLAWAAVNIRGTTAVIEVRSQVSPSKEDDPYAACDGVNLVAARDGLVVELEVIAGKPVVRRGSTVRAGELLVSGIIDSTRIGFRLTRSEGIVRAETQRTVTARVPYKYQKRVYSDECERDLWLVFFSKRIDLLSGYGSVSGEYNSVESLSLIALPGRGKLLPVGLGSRSRRGYYYVEAERTPAEAARLCEVELSRRIAAELGEGDYIVRRTTRTRDVGDGILMECELVLAENIAKRQGFYLGAGDNAAESKQ